MSPSRKGQVWAFAMLLMLSIAAQNAFAQAEPSRKKEGERPVSTAEAAQEDPFASVAPAEVPRNRRKHLIVRGFKGLSQRSGA